MRALLAPLATCALLVVAACTDTATPLAPPSSPKPLASKTPVAPFGPWGQIVEGETGPGSLYGIYVPTNWNGNVLYFIHGILPPSAPVALPQSPTDWDMFIGVRDQFGALGFAVVYSSFSENGLALKDAAQRTHQLRGLVASVLNGQPERSFVVGYSLGTAPALQLIEKYPNQYDGALMACGMVGGTPLQLQYIGHVRALFDFYYPNVLPGDANNIPEGFTPTVAQVTAIVQQAVAANPLGLFAIASTAQAPLAFVPGNVTVPGASQTSLVTSLVVALYYQIVGTPDLIDRTHGHVAFDNSNTTYTLGTPVVPGLAATLTAMIAAANAGVDRFTSPPDAQNFLEKYYVSTGDLELPVITVHNRWDYLVPYFHEAAFQQIVQEAGASDMLLQRTVLDFGHCFNPAFRAAVIQSVLDLVGWATTGVKPAS
jgi:pimeloyl-ACP methyl ester carboxylesterase